MNSLAISGAVFGCIFGGALLGLILRAMLPQHHLSTESKDVVKLGMGLVATMTALLLGLLVASAKSAYDGKKSTITELAAKAIFLDRVLANYGPDSRASRELLRHTISEAVERMWTTHRAEGGRDHSTAGEGLFMQIERLSPQDDAQRALKSQAVQLVTELGKLRWMLFAQAGSSIALPLLVVVVCWLTIIFGSFGLFAPPNATVVITLMLCALCVSGAVFLILEMDRPFDGLIQIPNLPMRAALEQMGH